MSIVRFEPLLGRWEGTGEGAFPTIAPFTYREHLTLLLDEERHFASLHSTAWKSRPGHAEEPSHHEVGVISLDGDDLVMSTIQNGTRYERLRGRLQPVTGGCVVEWTSEAYDNDPRVVRTTRRWEAVNGVLRYEMHMMTTAVDAVTLHLGATLRRA